jgi:hypothetical protein
VELTGYSRCGLNYAIGAVNGAGTSYSGKTTADFYARLSKVIGAGEGQTAGQRLGIMGYSGRSYPMAIEVPLEPQPWIWEGWESPAEIDAAVEWKQYSFYRLGADASLNYKWLNLALQYIYGNDSPEIWGPGDADISFWGGFAELSVLPSTCCVGFARFDYVNAPGYADYDIDRITVGGRYYPIDNLALHLEYSRRTMKMGDDLDDLMEDFATLRLDFAF